MIKLPEDKPNKNIKLVIKYNLVKELENKKTIMDNSKTPCIILNNIYPDFSSSFAMYAKAIPHPMPTKVSNIANK